MSLIIYSKKVTKSTLSINKISFFFILCTYGGIISFLILTLLPDVEHYSRLWLFYRMLLYLLDLLVNITIGPHVYITLLLCSHTCKYVMHCLSPIFLLVSINSFSILFSLSRLLNLGIFQSVYDFSF